MVSFLEVVFFTRHLSVMLKSGITIAEALVVLEAQNKSGAFKKVIKAIVLDIQNGQSLAKALTKHPKVFDPFYINIVSVGEETGKLDESLSYLNIQLSKKYLLRKKIRNALMYPSLVVMVALLAGLGMMIFVMPKLLDLFAGFSTKMPPITQLFIAIASYMQRYGVVTFIALICGILAVRILMFVPFFKKLIDHLLLALPLVGPILQNVSLTNMYLDLGFLMRSGVTITESLRITATITTQTVFKNYIEHFLAAVSQGKSLSQEMTEKKYAYIPLLATKMIAVGEKSGKLDETFLYLSDFFDEEVDDATKNITTVLEPALLLLIGLFVAFIALAIISPIYELTGSIQR